MSKGLKLGAVFIALLVVGVMTWQLKGKQAVQNISSFEECVAAGYPVMESYPEQCKTPDGRTFTNSANAQTSWQEQSVEEIGLTLRTPPDTRFRKEIGDDYGNIRTIAFYVEKGDENNPDYQLYALYQADKEGSVRDLELAKTEMDPATIKEATIAGYTGTEGLITGPKTRYITTVLKDGRLFSVSTYPPAPGNKELTDTIMNTFAFE